MDNDKTDGGETGNMGEAENAEIQRIFRSSAMDDWMLLWPMWGNWECTTGDAERGTQEEGKLLWIKFREN